MFRRLKNAVSGFAWLVRGNGLRAEVARLHPPEAVPPPPPPAPVFDPAVAEQVGKLEASAGERLARLEAVVVALAERVGAIPPPPPTEPFPLGLICERLDRIEVGVVQLQVWAGQQEAAKAGTDPAAVKAEWQRVGDLRAFERKVFSQQGEDGILEEIFHRIGTTNKFFVEFGVESGAECNAAHLAKNRGWGGLFMEGNPADVEKLKANYADFPAVKCVPAMVTSANVEQLFTDAGVPAEPDLLCIDIDGNDYWVWQAIERFRPRVLVMEYNPFHLPPQKWVMAEDPAFSWQRTTYFGASLTSLTLLSRRKGYELVGTDSNGVNAFFVRTDCLGDKFLDPVLHYHFTRFAYPPPPQGSGPFVEV
jgi:hypothetical protein